MKDQTHSGTAPPHRLTMLLAMLLSLAPAATSAAVLREARFDIEFTSATACRVRAAFAVDDTATVEHRLVVPAGTSATLHDVSGSMTADGEPVAQGRGRSLVLRASAAGAQRYGLEYEVAQAESYRCPLWLPTTPTDGRAQDVEIRVVLPSGAVPGGGTLPAFTWDGSAGAARLDHVPAFVRVPFGVDGAPAGVAGLPVTSLMDGVAMVALAGGVALFAWRRRRS